MGGSLARGLLAGTLFKPYDVVVANPHADKLSPLADLGATVTTDNRKAVADADFVAIVVKPWLVEKVAKEIAPVLHPERQVVLNLAASVDAANLQHWLTKDGGNAPALIQVMPNIAIALRASMTFLCPVKADNLQVKATKQIFDDLGKAIVVEPKQLAAGTALSGCGIAYAMRYVRAAMEGGVELGFKADVAQQIVLQTMEGAVRLLSQPGAHPESEIDKVTTPGGLTIRGLNAMESAGFTASVIAGLKA